MLSATTLQRAKKSVLVQQSLRVYCIVQFIDEIQKMPVCVWVYGASREIGCKVRRHDCRLYERLRCKEKEIWRGSGPRPPVWEHCRRVVLCNLYGPQVFYRPICLGLQTAHFATKWTRRQFGLRESKMTTWKRIGWWGVTGSLVYVDTLHVTSRSSGID